MTPAELLALAEENPYTGTSKQVVTLCLGIHQACEDLDPKVLRAARDEMPITDKIFSKLRVIGSLMSQLTQTQQKTAIRALPDSYNGIHSFCGLTPQELITAIKSKTITKSTTNRDARDLVKRIRYPVERVEQPKHDTTWRTILTINENPSAPLTPDDLLKVQQEMTKVLKGYGVEVRTPEKEESIRDLQNKQRAEQEGFWRTALEEHLTRDWFKETPTEVRKQFNLKTIEELWRTPLRQFTGFIVKSEGGRQPFWEKWGRAWVCKIHLEQLKTDDKTQRYNYTRRMQEIFDDETKGGRDLLLWRNKMLMGAGFPPL